jgi:hypothetical protein
MDAALRDSILFKVAQALQHAAGGGSFTMLQQRKGIRVRGQGLPHPARMRTTCVTAGTTTEDSGTNRVARAPESDAALVGLETDFLAPRATALGVTNICKARIGLRFYRRQCRRRLCGGRNGTRARRTRHSIHIFEAASRRSRDQ